MNKISTLLIGGGLILVSSIGFAASKTDMAGKWICTTNASSSDLDSDKEADKKMSSTASSAAGAYAFAAQNCRDCTKITCEAQS
jgi:hypothetical protein